MSLDIKEQANQLTVRFNTNDPFEIADYLGIIVSVRPLGDLNGYILLEKGFSFVSINSSLDDHQRALVCGHEIGHHILHQGFNRIFMDSCTLSKTDLYEIEADRFAVDLLYNDDELYPFLDYGFDTIARCLGISEDQAEYRISTVNFRNW